MTKDFFFFFITNKHLENIQRTLLFTSGGLLVRDTNKKKNQASRSLFEYPRDYRNQVFFGVSRIQILD